MKRVYENGSDHYIDVYQGGVETTRQLKLRQLSKIRKRVEQGGVEYSGIIIRTDEGSLAKIVSTVLALQTGMAKTVDWKGVNGWIRDVDYNTMTQIAKTVTEHVQFAFSTENRISEELKNASDDEVENYDVQARWDAIYQFYGR